MKIENLLLIGAIAAGAYFLIGNKSVFGVTGTEGYYGSFPANTSEQSGNTNQTEKAITQPNVSGYSPVIFQTTTAKAADRFIIDPFSGGGGVQDRYAQQSITTEEAKRRAALAIFKA